MSGAAGESVRSGGGSAWYRATYADGEPAGFVMLHDENLRPEPSASPAIELWRFMVDADRQGRGIGREAMALVLAHARERGAVELLVSYVPGENSPEGFYQRARLRAHGRRTSADAIRRGSAESSHRLH